MTAGIRPSDAAALLNAGPRLHLQTSPTNCSILSGTRVLGPTLESLTVLLSVGVCAWWDARGGMGKGFTQVECCTEEASGVSWPLKR
mmetsp:Transcript_17577/g.27160  ORF Transcript_17577/g.27160 Transcript_17577/m.27160 type:complete len:87 (+) Transcript_17577:453-713(+)